MRATTSRDARPKRTSTRTDSAMTQLEELTPEEKARPYSKYYYLPLAEPNAELKAAREMPPMDPSKAQMPENINDFLEPGLLRSRNGVLRPAERRGLPIGEQQDAGCDRRHDQLVVRLAQPRTPALQDLVSAGPQEGDRERARAEEDPRPKHSRAAQVPGHHASGGRGHIRPARRLTSGSTS